MLAVAVLMLPGLCRAERCRAMPRRGRMGHHFRRSAVSDLDETHDAPDPPTASHSDRSLGTRTYDPAKTFDRPAVSRLVETDPGAIPGYEIIEEIGRGGMGVVYRARQLGLNREVAIKTLLPSECSRALAARFWA